MLVRTCDNRNFHALLTGMQIGVPTLEDSFVVDSCWCMAKPIQYCKVKKKINKHTPTIQGASLMAQMVKHPPVTWETQVWSLDWEDPLEKEMAVHSSILAWRIRRTVKPDGLQSMELQNWIQLSNKHFHFYHTV